MDIKYPKLIAFLKRQNQGYKPNKAKTFSREEVNKFLLEAPDNNYLLMKVRYFQEVNILKEYKLYGKYYNRAKSIMVCL